MPLDHYVPQVYLRRWLNPESGLLHAISKKDLKVFSPTTKVVCAIQDGSTNKYLDDQRLVEKYLEEFENNYNHAVDKIDSGTVDILSLRTIAGLVSCISSASPTAARLHIPFMKEVVKSTARQLNRQGIIQNFNGLSVCEMFEAGFADAFIDGKYPQAFGIKSIEKTAELFTRSSWEIIRNVFSDSPFFSSDYPIGVVPSMRFSNIMDKIIPLNPRLALRIKPHPQVKKDLTSLKIDVTERFASRNEIRAINQVIVRSAENLVFCAEQFDWMYSFVKRNRFYRTEGVPSSVRIANGFSVITKIQIVEYSPSQSKERPPSNNDWFEIRGRDDGI